MIMVVEPIVLEKPVGEVDFDYIEKMFKQHFPSNVTLTYVDYRDNLNDNLDKLQEAISKNDMLDLENWLTDYCFDDSRFYAIGDYTERFKKDVLNDIECIDEDDEQYELAEQIRDYLEESDFEEQFQDYLYENDDSDALNDMLRNTSELGVFYDLSEWFDESWCMNEDELREYLDRLYGLLHLQKNDENDKHLKTLMYNASGGGYLRIYFNIKFEEMISGDKNGCKFGRSEDDEYDFGHIHFNGTFMVGIINPYEGSGMVEDIPLDMSLKFVRDNLKISKTEKYSYEKVFGAYSDYNVDEPVFCFGDEGNEVKTNEAMKAYAEREAEYERVFKAGGCTFGDMDYNRHRDVYYKNEIPCGSHCPHCGTFWID